MAAPTLSELIRRLERELGTPLFTRTTRRVAMTSAGVELLARSKVTLDDVAAADAAVRRVAGGDAGTVRLGITPPVGPVLAPHLISRFATEAQQVTVDLQRMWLPSLTAALISGGIDVAITCGLIPASAGTANEVFCAEPLLVGLRPDHRLAGQEHGLAGGPGARRSGHHVGGPVPRLGTEPASGPSDRWYQPARRRPDRNRPVRHPMGRPAGGGMDPAHPVPLGRTYRDRGAAGRTRATGAVHPAVESRPCPHHRGRPIRPGRAHRGTAARLAHPARPPASPGLTVFSYTG